MPMNEITQESDSTLLPSSEVLSIVLAYSKCTSFYDFSGDGIPMNLKWLNKN
ncbi:MAG: Uncharacterised protein [Owenweeksia sp. TMED14]|nr:MAG: Uncharacterised protein [Owenweeksia sp. TMED14]